MGHAGGGVTVNTRRPEFARVTCIVEAALDRDPRPGRGA
jgi:hypothetical protein